MNVNPELTFHSHSKQYQHTKTPKKEGQVNIPYNLLLYFYLKIEISIKQFYTK